MDFFEAVIPVIAIIFTFGIPGIIVFWYLYSRHRERMRLIEKGLTPEEVKSYFREVNNKPKNPYSSLKWGILLSFVGFSIILSYLLSEFTDMSDEITPAFILFFAGAGFITYYLIMNSKMKKDSAGRGTESSVQ